MGCKLSSGKPKRSRPHRRHRCRWQDVTEINITGKVFMIMWARFIKIKTLVNGCLFVSAMHRRTAVSCPFGPFLTGAENLAPERIRSPDRPARSESPYRLYAIPVHYVGALEAISNYRFMERLGVMSLTASRQFLTLVTVVFLCCSLSSDAHTTTQAPFRNARTTVNASSTRRTGHRAKRVV